MNNLECDVAKAVKALGCAIESRKRMAGSWGLHCERWELGDGRKVLAKWGSSQVPDQLAIEGGMLRDLAELSCLPVPNVLYCQDNVLVTEWIDGDHGLTDKHQQHAGEIVAALHGVHLDFYGYQRDTTIGGLAQPNPQYDSWVEFFRVHRLLHMARVAHEAGGLSNALRLRTENFAEHLERWIDEPKKPSLLHGDMWGGNIIAGKKGRISAFIDPAIYAGHPEIELAFTTLFGTFGAPFFDAYKANAILEPDFLEIRRGIYNLYPLLVHAALFGPSYASGIDRLLGRLGY